MVKRAAHLFDVRNMLASPYGLLFALLAGVVMGYFFTLRTVGSTAVVLFGADIAAMFISGLLGASQEVVWGFGLAGMALPIYGVIAYIGAQAGRSIREKLDDKS
jgi:hypothetical protein